MSGPLRDDLEGTRTPLTQKIDGDDEEEEEEEDIVLLRSYMMQMTQNAPFSLSLSLSLSHCACMCVVVVTLTMYTHTGICARYARRSPLPQPRLLLAHEANNARANACTSPFSSHRPPYAKTCVCVCVENGDISSRDNDALLMLKYVCLYALHMYVYKHKQAPKEFPFGGITTSTGGYFNANEELYKPAAR